jgi:hypothetical protein
MKPATFEVARLTSSVNSNADLGRRAPSSSCVAAPNVLPQVARPGTSAGPVTIGTATGTAVTFVDDEDDEDDVPVVPAPVAAVRTNAKIGTAGFAISTRAGANRFDRF